MRTFFVMLATSLVAATLLGESRRISARGWFADEKCASTRAQHGTYTSTSPECARKCLKQGSPLVFIAEEQKALFRVAKTDEYVSHVGEYVELAGTVDDAGRLTIESLKTIEKVGPSCSRR